MDIMMNSDWELELYVDEDNRIALFTKSKNPSYGGPPAPMFLPTKTPIELNPPHSIDKLATSLEFAFELWNKTSPYPTSYGTIEEYYYQIKGHKKASFRKRLVSVGWSSFVGKNVRLCLPVKTGQHYLAIETIYLSDDADWTNFAEAVIELINTNITQMRRYKAFKNKFNV